MSKYFLTVILLLISNTFMTFAWYGHLRFKEFKWFENTGLIGVILLSWFIAFFEYLFLIPANKLGHESNGGPFNIMQLRIIQEVVSLSVFAVISTVFLNGGQLKWNHFAAFLCMLLAVYFIFKK